MYDSKIVSAEALSAGFEGRIRPLRNMFAVVADCTFATADFAAAQDGQLPDFDGLVGRYARAGTVARRRIDALISEAEVESLAGCSLIARRGDRTTAGTGAAVRFLHDRMQATFRRIDGLLPLAA